MIELAKPTREEFRLAGEELHQQMLQRFDDLMAEDKDYLDEDGYPTDHALDLIQAWPWSDPKGWFDFIKELWAYRDWGWTETEGGVDDWTEQQIPVTTTRFHISTAGWSGNESIIRAMEKNDMLWHFHWVQSRRGGHYIFELKGNDD